MRKPIIIIFIFFSFKLIAQPYHNALGIRFGLGSGITFKSFINSQAAIEGIASFQFDFKGYTLTGLYEIHNYKALKAANLALVYGFGAHIGYYDGAYYKKRNKILYLEQTATVGIDAILGIDYFIVGSPINFSMDIKPFFDFVNPGFRFWDGAVSIRYVFN
jgi:hypothetical protein